MSYPNDRTLDDEITVEIWLPLQSVHVSQPIAQTSLVWWKLMQTRLHNFM